MNPCIYLFSEKLKFLSRVVFEMIHLVLGSATGVKCYVVMLHGPSYVNGKFCWFLLVFVGFVDLVLEISFYAILEFLLWENPDEFFLFFFFLLIRFPFFSIQILF